MPFTEELGDWKYLRTVESDENGRTVRYKIHFYRRSSGDEWYDEIRYDSHEMKRGQDLRAPHFHMKLRSAFKMDDQMAIEEIRRIIDNYLKEIEGVLGE